MTKDRSGRKSQGSEGLGMARPARLWRKPREPGQVDGPTHPNTFRQFSSFDVTMIINDGPLATLAS